MKITLGVFGAVINDLKPMLVKALPIGRFIETCVINGAACGMAATFARFRATGKHQGRIGGRMSGEDGEHGALIIRSKMKEAVPGQDRIEFGPKIKRPHICVNGLRVGQVLSEKSDHRRGPVNAGHGKPALCQISGQGQAGTTAQIKQPTG